VKGLEKRAMDCEVLAEMLVDQTELLFRHGPHKLIGKNARGECFVLRCLARSKAPLLPSDLSEQSHASTARIAVVLNTLEKKGLISRAIDPTDRRRILVSLTNVGQEYVAVVRTQLREDMKHLLEELGEQDAREYLRITKRILQISQEEFEERNRSVG
jgi:DNA-binding MarR family transcriptional regulator